VERHEDAASGSLAPTPAYAERDSKICPSARAVTLVKSTRDGDAAE
jgi:hypothetical protein